MVWVSAAANRKAIAAVTKKYGSSAYKAGKLTTKKYQKYKKKRGSSYRKRQAFYVDRGYSYDPPPAVSQDNTIIVLAAGVVGYFLLKQAGETATEAAKGVLDDTYTSVVDKIRAETSAENVQEAGFNLMGRVIDYQKWMMGMVFNAEAGAVSAVTETAKTAINSASSYASDIYDSQVAQVAAYNNQLIGLLDNYVDMNILDRNVAANAANVAAGNASIVDVSTGSGNNVPVVSPTLDDKVVKSVYNPVVDHYSSIISSSPSSSSSSSNDRYSSTGRYLGKKASWMK